MKIKKYLKNLALVGTASAGVIHGINKSINQISTSDHRLSKKKGLYYDSNFGRIFYTVQGNGSPILLIHDLDVCSSSYEWNNIISKLSKSNTVYMIDLLGCGRSDKSNLVYTSYLYMQVINNFIIDVIKDSTDIIATGHSSSIAIMACSTSNSMIKKVILVNPDSIYSTTRISKNNIKRIKFLFSTPFIGTLIYNLKFNRQSIERVFYQKYFYDTKKITQNTIMTYWESSQKEKANGKYLYSSRICGFTNTNIVHILKNLDNDIYIIVGSSDPSNLNNANEYLDYLPQSKIRKLEYCKYLPQLELPDKFAFLVEDILKEKS